MSGLQYECRGVVVGVLWVELDEDNTEVGTGVVHGG